MPICINAMRTDFTHVTGNTDVMVEKKLAHINKVTTRQIGGDSKLDNKESINNTKDVDNIMVMKDVVEMEEGTFARVWLIWLIRTHVFALCIMHCIYKLICCLLQSKLYPRCAHVGVQEPTDTSVAAPARPTDPPRASSRLHNHHRQHLLLQDSHFDFDPILLL